MLLVPRHSFSPLARVMGRKPGVLTVTVGLVPRLVPMMRMTPFSVGERTASQPLRLRLSRLDHFCTLPEKLRTSVMVGGE